MPHPLELSLLLHRALASRLDRLLELCGADGWQHDPEALHQIRIASRRVRAVLDLADQDLYPGFKKQERHLRRLTKALGLTRELDVHADILESLKDRHPDPLQAAAAEHLLERLDRKRRKARETMRQDLDRISLKDLVRLREAPGLQAPPGTEALPRAAWSCLEPWVRAVEGPLPSLLDAEDITGLHRLRIHVKRLRYSLEILEPAFPCPQEANLRRLKDLQTALGQHHDQALLEALLRETHATLAARGRTTLASGALKLLERVVEDRRARFRSLGQEFRGAGFLLRLRQSLGEALGAME